MDNFEHAGYWWGDAGFRAVQEYVEHNALPFGGGTLDQPREFWEQVDEYRAIRYALMVEALPEARAQWNQTGRGDGTE